MKVLYCLSSFEKHLDAITKLGRLPTPLLLVVSSLGNFSFSKSDTDLAKASGFFFSLTGTRCCPIFATYVATIDGQLSVTHSYYPHVTSKSIATQYCSKFLEIVERMVLFDKEKVM